MVWRALIYAGLLLAAISISVALWLIQEIATYAWHRYRSAMTQQTQTSLSELFVFVDTSLLWPALWCVAVTTGLSIWFVTKSIVTALILACCTLVLPKFILTGALRQRLAKFDSQWPDALMAIAGSLRSGASIGIALKTFAEDAPTPMSQEISLVLREHRMGIPLNEALNGLNHRMPSESVELVTALLAVGNASGGSLAELLERLAANLRSRQHVSGKIDVLTAQGKMQAWVMGALPLILLAALSQIDSASVELMFLTQTGQIMLGLVCVLECVGVYWLRRILTIEV
jgi:tight adherence protein B